MSHVVSDGDLVMLARTLVAGGHVQNTVTSNLHCGYGGDIDLSKELAGQGLSSLVHLDGDDRLVGRSS